MLFPGDLILKESQGRIYSVNEDLKDRIQAAKNYDDSVTWAIDQLLHGTRPTLVPKEWTLVDGFVSYNWKIYIPKDEELRRELVALHHNTPTAGHPGHWKTLEKIQRNYWWPGITKFVKKYIVGCDHCQ